MTLTTLMMWRIEELPPGYYRNQETRLKKKLGKKRKHNKIKQI